MNGAVPNAYLASLCRITSTEHLAWRATASETLPITTLSNPLRPWDPTTIKSACQVSASFKITRYGRSSRVGTSEHTFNAEPERIFTPALTQDLASSIEACPKSLASCSSRYEGSLNKMNSGMLITFATLFAGQMRLFDSFGR